MEKNETNIQPIITPEDMPGSVPTEPAMEEAPRLIEVPESVQRALAGAAAEADAQAIVDHASAVHVSNEIHQGAQAAGIDAGLPLYDEQGNLTSQPQVSGNSQAGLAAVRHQ